MVFGRKAKPSDQAAISSLIKSCGGMGKFRNRFGAFHLATLLELGYLPIVATDEDDDSVQCAVIFSDRPRDPSDEEQEATLWVALSVSRQDSRISFEKCLKTAFDFVPEIDRVVVQGSFLPPECGTRHFKNMNSFFQCDRDTVVPTLRTREAKVEATDDLVPLFQKPPGSRSRCLNLGDLVLAELIESQDDTNRAVVATYQGRAVGLVSVSTDVDLATLQNCFQLESYPDISEPASTSGEEIAASSDHNNHGIFAMTLFCLDNEHKSRASDFFPAMFELFPERKYCVLTAPPDLRSDSHLLRNFTAVPSKSGSTFSHSLFLLHRDSLLAPKHLKVARFDKSKHNVSTFCEAGLKAALERCGSGQDEENEEAAFAAVINDVVVGIVVLDSRSASTEELNLLKSTYEVEDYVPFERHRARSQSVVSHCLVEPVYLRHTRFIVKECMQLYDKTVLYHQTCGEGPPPPTILSEFVPIKSRHRSNQNGVLHFFSRRHASDAKRRVCARIVVAGATPCAVGFLETLLFCDETIDFPNVTLLGSFESQQRQFAPVDMDLPASFPPALACRTRTINAAVKSIDRENRVVVLTDDALVPYDILVLANGLEESTQKRLVRRDAPLDILSHTLERADEMIRTPFTDVADKVPMASPPPHPDEFSFVRENDEIKGLLSLSSPSALERISKHQTVLVYGGTLLALTAIDSLLKRGTAPSILKLAVPGNSLDTLGDAVVDRMVLSSLESCALSEIKFGRRLRSLRYDGGKLVGVWFDDNTSVECDIVLGADAEDTPRDIYQAVNEAGLVYDGRLVVSENFETSDAAIYAAGRNTKFSSYKSSNSSHGIQFHDDVNELEIGARLATCVFDKLLSREKQEKETRELLFAKPRTVTATLPGGLHFCRSKLPGVSVSDTTSLPTGALHGYSAGTRADDDAVARNSIRSLKELSTTRNRYSILKVDGHGLVCDFIYVGTDPITVEPQLVARMIGLQESWLYSAWTRYDRGEVDDWVDYLGQDWVSAIYFDRFDTLRKQVNDILLCDDNSRQLVARLLKELEKQHSLSNEKGSLSIRHLRNELIGLGGCKLSPATRDLVDKAVLGYLRKNRVLLPTFHLPEQERKRNEQAVNMPP